MALFVQNDLSQIFTHKPMGPYLRLMRLDRPIGMWLCLLPALWGLLLGAPHIPYRSIVIFVLGAILVRGAGCTINDIWDRHIDQAVARTKSRPLAQQDLSLFAALLWFVAQGIAALTLLIFLPSPLLWVAIVLALLIVVYPLMKRYTYWPQIFLGLVFNGGLIMGWLVHHGAINLGISIIYIGCVLWTLGYDTIYAFQDIDDDQKVGIKSAALKLGFQKGKPFVVACYALFLGCIASGTLLLSFHGTAWGIFAVSPWILWRVSQINLKDQTACGSLFLQNRNIGLLIFTFILLERGIK